MHGLGLGGQPTPFCFHTLSRVTRNCQTRPSGTNSFECNAPNKWNLISLPPHRTCFARSRNRWRPAGKKWLFAVVKKKKRRMALSDHPRPCESYVPQSRHGNPEWARGTSKERRENLERCPPSSETIYSLFLTRELLRNGINIELPVLSFESNFNKGTLVRRNFLHAKAFPRTVAVTTVRYKRQYATFTF